MPRKNEKLSATARMKASRRSSERSAINILTLVAIFSRVWPGSHRCELPTGEKAICLHSPGGPLVWRQLVHDDEETNKAEALLFAHLPQGANHADDPKGLYKWPVLRDLAVNGWK